MRWLLLGLLTLNVLQAIYILSYEDGSGLPANIEPIAIQATSAPLNAIKASTNTAPNAYKQTDGLRVLAQEVTLVRRSLVNDLVESGKGLNSVRFALWPKGGFLATYVKQASLVAHLGLMKGDIVKSINNTQMSSVLHALSIYQDLEDLHMLELGIERKGKAISYFYKLID